MEEGPIDADLLRIPVGPGSIHVAHTPDEYIDVAELRSSVDAYERIARQLLAS